MNKGISLYPGLDKSADIRQSLDLAADHDIGTYFCSLHIPESDVRALKRDLRYILADAAAKKMEVIADISPTALSRLHLTAEDLFRSHITLRLDDGFTAEETVRCSLSGTVCLNASTVTAAFLQKLSAGGADFSRIKGLHNFYPRPGTGLMPAFFASQTALCHAYGLSVGAVVAAVTNRRGPLYEGLPTIENTRSLSIEKSAFVVKALGADHIFIGDSRPCAKDMQALSAAAQTDADIIIIPVILRDTSEKIRKLLNRIYTPRPDKAEHIIRAKESRTHAKGLFIKPLTTLPARRQRGDITVDNADFLRYAGEIQLITAPMPAEPRTNTIAAIPEEHCYLLDCLCGDKKFTFRFIE